MEKDARGHAMHKEGFITGNFQIRISKNKPNAEITQPVITIYRKRNIGNVKMLQHAITSPAWKSDIYQDK